MPATKGSYQGKPVTITRPAKAGDPGFSATAGDQLLIKQADNTEKAVPKAEVTEAE